MSSREAQMESVGIDLGTTHTAIARIKIDSVGRARAETDGGAQLVAPNAIEERTPLPANTPSITMACRCGLSRKS